MKTPPQVEDIKTAYPEAFELLRERLGLCHRYVVRDMLTEWVYRFGVTRKVAGSLLAATNFWWRYNGRHFYHCREHKSWCLFEVLEGEDERSILYH